MSKTVTISEHLAELVEARQKASRLPSLDAAAEMLIVHGLASDADEGHNAGRTDAELMALLDEAEASGPAELWDAAAVRAEVLRRFAARRAG